MKKEGYIYFIDENSDISCGNEDEVRQCSDIDEQYKYFLIGEDFERKRIEAEERKKLKEQKLRYEIRKKLLAEEFKDFPQDSRVPIPEEVRHEVWRRDGGKCVKCGSRENLEYDHIIPLSKGGSNTVRNIELLCEKCNREKRDNIR